MNSYWQKIFPKIRLSLIVVFVMNHHVLSISNSCVGLMDSHAQSVAIPNIGKVAEGCISASHVNTTSRLPLVRCKRHRAGVPVWIRFELHHV